MLLPPDDYVPEPVPDWIPILALNPSGKSSPFPVFVSKALLLHLEEHGPEMKCHDACGLPEGVEAPNVVFAGLKRAGYEEALCFCSRPERRKVGHGEWIESPPDRVFLVFVHETEGQQRILDWEWRRADPTNPNYPIHWTADFMRQIWPLP